MQQTLASHYNLVNIKVEKHKNIKVLKLFCGFHVFYLFLVFHGMEWVLNSIVVFILTIRFRETLSMLITYPHDDLD